MYYECLAVYEVKNKMNEEFFNKKNEVYMEIKRIMREKEKILAELRKYGVNEKEDLIYQKVPIQYKIKENSLANTKIMKLKLLRRQSMD